MTYAFYFNKQHVFSTHCGVEFQRCSKMLLKHITKECLCSNKVPSFYHFYTLGKLHAIITLVVKESWNMKCQLNAKDSKILMCYY